MDETDSDATSARDAAEEVFVAAPLPAPHDAATLGGVFASPLRALDVVLTNPARLTQTITSGKHVALLAGVLLYVTVLFTIPFGAVLEPARFWRVGLLLIGTLGICLPSLQVFSAYIGVKINLRQNLALGLVIVSVAALFCFGFFPILWFLDATMLSDSVITPHGISASLLLLSFIAGVGHLLRCFRSFEGLGNSYCVLVFAWLVLFHFIAYRMALLLELI